MLKLLHSWILCIHTARHLSASADLSTKCLLTCHLVQLILSQHACHTILDKQTKLKLHLKDTFLTLTQHYIPLQSASPAGKEKELRDGWHFSKLTTVNNTHIHVPPTVEQYTPWQLPNIIYWCSTNRCLKYLSTQFPLFNICTITLYLRNKRHMSIFTSWLCLPHLDTCIHVEIKNCWSF